MSIDREELTRRSVLGGIVAAASGLGACAATPARASASPAAPAVASTSDELVPLPFRANALRGISERMIESHHAKNYGGAVKNLAACTKQLAGLGDDAPGFVVAALRERELVFRNSKTLHEAYFGNLGGDGKPSAAMSSALASAFGSAGAWERQLRAAAGGLGGGSGWVVLSFELASSQLRIVATGNHSQAQAEAMPLLVLDMYEHAYQLDYGAEAARYVDAFFANVQWDEVERRWERARRLAAAWQG